MDVFNLDQTKEWLQQLNEIIEQMEDADDGELTSSIEFLSQGVDDIEQLVS